MLNKMLSKITSLRSIFSLVSIIFLSVVSVISAAAPYTPKSNDIVAVWESSKASLVSQTTDSTSTTLQAVSDHLQQAQFPGQANIHHAMARSILVKLADTEQFNSEYWYLIARSLQHQHEFEQSLLALEKSLNSNANYPSALLLKANIHIAQSNFAEAKKACSQLIGNIDLITVATCSMEVASYDGNLSQSYEQLTTILKRSDLSGYAEDEQFWQAQVLADMALRLGFIKQAEQWMIKGLDGGELANTPLSYIALWSDIQRELGNHRKIYAQLSSILTTVNFKDDALLVRLAMAEKAFQSANKEAVENASPWQELVATRIQLRLQRQDYYHAADIARYYIYVQTSPKEALKWATINYQQARLFDDEKLLLEAKRLNNVALQKEELHVSG